MKRWLRFAALAALWLAAPAAADEAPAVLDALLPDGRLTERLSDLAARPGLAPDEPFKVTEITDKIMEMMK